MLGAQKRGDILLQKLGAGNHAQPFKGSFSITRIEPGLILGNKPEDTAFGPLANIDHAVMKKGLTIKMHEHVNDEILSYVSSGVDRKSTRLNSSHVAISYAVLCLHD